MNPLHSRGFIHLSQRNFGLNRVCHFRDASTCTRLLLREVRRRLAECWWVRGHGRFKIITVIGLSRSGSVQVAGGRRVGPLPVRSTERNDGTIGYGRSVLGAAAVPSRLLALWRLQ